MLRQKKRSTHGKRYTVTQVSTIYTKMHNACANGRKGAVGRTTASLARRYGRTERAINAKYSRLSGQWADTVGVVRIRF